MRDEFNCINPVKLFAPAAAVTDNTALVSSWIDRRGFEAVTCVLQAGSLADADATFATTIEHADASDQADAEAVPAAQLLGTTALASFTFADDNKVKKLGYVGNKRYVRVTITPSGNTGNAFFAGTVLLGEPAIAPTANPPV